LGIIFSRKPFRPRLCHCSPSKPECRSENTTNTLVCHLRHLWKTPEQTKLSPFVLKSTFEMPAAFSCTPDRVFFKNRWGAHEIATSHPEPTLRRTTNTRVLFVSRTLARMTADRRSAVVLVPTAEKTKKHETHPACSKHSHRRTEVQSWANRSPAKANSNPSRRARFTAIGEPKSSQGKAKSSQGGIATQPAHSEHSHI
jgi:hypothetical protein